MERSAALDERVSFGLIAPTHNQNLLLADVSQSELYEVWLELARHQLAMTNIAPHGMIAARLRDLPRSQRRHDRGGRADPGALRQFSTDLTTWRFETRCRGAERLAGITTSANRHPRRDTNGEGVVQITSALSHRHSRRIGRRSSVLSAKTQGRHPSSESSRRIATLRAEGRALHRTQFRPRGALRLQERAPMPTPF